MNGIAVLSASDPSTAAGIIRWVEAKPQQAMVSYGEYQMGIVAGS
jgi:hypothetical protein